MTLKLGVLGAEQDLPLKSRIFNGEEVNLIKYEARSINGTLKSNYIAYKRTWKIGWDVVAEATKDILADIIKLQLTNGHLSFIKSKSDGTLEYFTVSVSLEGFGAELPKGDYYYYGTGLILEEV